MLTFNMHIGDWMKSTVHLTDAERGIYLSLLLRYYDTEQPLPRDREAVYRLACARNANAMRDVDIVLDEFFELEDDGWHNKRADEEIAAYRDKSEKAKRSAEARWGGSRCTDGQQKQSEGNADAMRTHSEGNANHIPRTTNHDLDTDVSKSKGAGYPQEFEEAWAAYPSRPGASKKDAHKAWAARIKAGADHLVILEGVQRYARYCMASRTEPQYIKQPSTFFGPGEHYLAEWSLPAGTPTGQQHRSSIHEQRAATIAGLTGRTGQPAGDVLEGFADRVD